MTECNEDFVVKIAHTPQEFSDLYNLRYVVYCEDMHTLDPANYPDKEERDEYDQHSVHIIVKNKKNAVIGTLRLVKDNPNGFVMEDVFKLPPDIDRLKTLEHSRGAIRKDHQGQGIYTMLLEKAYEWQREHGYLICIGAPRVDRLSVILLRKGWKPIGKQKHYHNEIVLPMVFFLTR